MPYYASAVRAPEQWTTTYAEAIVCEVCDYLSLLRWILTVFRRFLGTCNITAAPRSI